MGYVCEKKGTYKGYKYSVCMMDLGHRCGYVGVPKGHPLYGKNYGDDDAYFIDCHGGLTYSTSNVGSSYPIKEENELWWFGWDYGHYMDGKDYEGMAKNFGNDVAERSRIWDAGLYDDCFVYYPNDVENDCKFVIEQIVERYGEVK